jgi:ATP-dependent helicase YprA (DUF1998 family)
VIDAVLQVLGAWVRSSAAAPWRWGLVASAVVIVAGLALGGLARARLELRSDRVAAGPIFAVSGLGVLAFAIVWWAADAVLAAAGQLLIEERLMLLLAPRGAGEEFLRELFQLRADERLMPPPVVHLPLSLLMCGLLYVIAVLWIGSTLSELTSLEQKPEDVLARERAALQKAIDQALKEGRPIPVQDVVSVPLADDRLGRVFKLLGHWTSVELVEERFVRWQRALVTTLTATLLLALPAALGGHLAAPLWVGAAVALDGLRRNLRTRLAAPPVEPAAQPIVAPPPPPVPSLQPLLEAIHRETGVVAALPSALVPQGARISPGTDLEAKRVIEDLRRELDLPDGLYVHQGLACDAFAAQRSVLITSAPLSGRQVLADLLVFYTLLVDGENVLHLAPTAAAARLAEQRFRARAEQARWRWNVSTGNIAGRAGALDLARAQPRLLFADPESVHLTLCGKQREWAPYLASLGLMVVPDIDRYDGSRGAHLAQLCRRLRRAVARAAPKTDGQDDATRVAERVRVLATAAPLYRDLARFAERILGRPLTTLGPEVDGAPQPARATYVLAPATRGGQSLSASLLTDIHPAVHSLGEALAQGFAAELFGFEDVLSSDDVARANEVMVARGVATRGRALAIGSERWGAPGEALASAQVVIARASSQLYPVLPVLTAHLGMRAGPLPPARVAALGAGEHVGVGAAPVPLEKDPPPADAAGPEGAGDPEVPQAPQQTGGVVLTLWQPDLEPLSLLFARERPPPAHRDLQHGCVLAVDPLAEAVQVAHLYATLAEAPTRFDDLARDFGKALLEAELAAVGEPGRDGDGASPNPPGTPTHADRRLIETVRREIDTAGVVREVRWLEIGGGAEVHAGLSLATSGPAARVLDRHSGEVLLEVPRERALAAAYPGRVFVHAGRRFVVLPLEAQDRVAEQVIVCEREERPLSTSRIRRLTVRPLERRQAGDRRALPREPEGGRRAQPARTLGGAAFGLEVRRVEVEEEVIGLRRHGPDGRQRDAAAYAEPISARFVTRATLMTFPRESFAETGEATLHALSHLLRTTLPAFVRHDDEDLDITWSPGAPGEPATIAFVDAHPGGVGFAEAVTLDALRAATRWSLALCRRCPANCGSPTGCPRCLQIQRCHAEPARQQLLDRAGAQRVLAELLGE